MRRLLFVTSLVLLLLLCAGCISLSHEMVLRDDGSLEMKMDYSTQIDDMDMFDPINDDMDMFDPINDDMDMFDPMNDDMDMFDPMEPEIEEDAVHEETPLGDPEELLERGYEVEERTEEGTYYITVSKNFDNFQEVTYWDIFAAEDENDPTANELVFTRLNGNYQFAMPNMMAMDDDMDAMSLEMMKDYIDAQVKLTLPTEPSEHNAASVSEDGKTLEWDLMQIGLDDELTAQFSLGGIGNLMLYIIIGAAALVLILIIILLVKRKSKNGGEVPQVSSEE